MVLTKNTENKINIYKPNNFLDNGKRKIVQNKIF